MEITGKLKDPSAMEFGETPFDGLSREQLLVLLLKHQIAMDKLYNVVQSAKGLLYGPAADKNPYWRQDGVGGNALAIADDVRGIYAKGQQQHSDMFYSFHRYAIGMFFPEHRRGVAPWMKCDHCNCFTSVIKSGDAPPVCLCGGTLSTYEMKDLRPDLDVVI